MVTLLFHGTPGQAYNVGSGVGVTVEVLAMAATLASHCRPKHVDAMTDNRPTTSVADATRLRALGWSPWFSLSESLRDQWG